MSPPWNDGAAVEPSERAHGIPSLVRFASRGGTARLPAGTERGQDGTGHRGRAGAAVRHGKGEGHGRAEKKERAPDSAPPPPPPLRRAGPGAATRGEARPRPRLRLGGRGPREEPGTPLGTGPGGSARLTPAPAPLHAKPSSRPPSPSPHSVGLQRDGARRSRAAQPPPPPPPPPPARRAAPATMASRCSAQAAPGLSALTGSHSDQSRAHTAKLSQRWSGGGTDLALYKAGQRGNTAVGEGKLSQSGPDSCPPAWCHHRTSDCHRTSDVTGSGGINWDCRVGPSLHHSKTRRIYSNTPVTLYQIHVPRMCVFIWWCSVLDCWNTTALLVVFCAVVAAFRSYKWLRGGKKPQNKKHLYNIFFNCILITLYTLQPEVPFGGYTILEVPLFCCSIQARQ